MYQKDYDKKFRFSLFLPYGVASGSALAITVHKDETFGRTDFEIASMLYDPELPMHKRVQAVNQAYTIKRRHITKMETTGYAVKKPINYGKRESETVSCYRPTLSAFFYLTSTASDTEESKRLKTIATKNPNRTQRRTPFSDTELERIDAINDLNELAIGKDSTAERSAHYQKYLLQSVHYCGFSPLALEPQLARKITMTPAERGRSLYRELRLSNIEILFRENGFLTSIDRRHIPCIQAEETTDPKKQDIKWFCKHVLHRWYEENPDFYYFLQEEPNADPKMKEIWQTIPAFYSVQDIPGYYSLLEDKKSRLEIPEMNIPGSNQLLRHTCDGVAVGKRETYIIHHTRPTETPWYIGIEKNTIMSTEMIFKRLKKKQTFLGCDRSVRNAIIVCSSVNHFAELFTKKPRNLPSQWDSDKLISRPYDNVNIVLLNTSGVTQLRFLMLSNPIQYDELAKRKLLTFDGFTDRPKSGSRKNDIFALSYDHTPVFLAYSLNWQNLYWAKEKYEAGENFYVCCYPEQVKYIKKIIPEVKFL